jgi:hypothetical protein
VFEVVDAENRAYAEHRQAEKRLIAAFQCDERPGP